MKTCSVARCERAHIARGYCTAHYSRFREHGDPLGWKPLRMNNVHETFLSLASLETDDCVIWPRSRSSSGYGRFRRDGVEFQAHVEALTLRAGPRPTGVHVAAHGPCHNPACINYRHLRWATPRENQADRFRDGTAGIGSSNPQAKLTESKVLEIRSLLAGGQSQAEIGRTFGVSQSQIWAIKSGRAWKHVA